jgi:hypothetical protein
MAIANQTESATRKVQRWRDLTPRTPGWSGDLIKTWDFDRDEPFKGWFIGYEEINGQTFAEVEHESKPTESKWFGMMDRVVIILAAETHIVDLDAARAAADLTEQYQREDKHDLRVLAALVVASVIGWTALILTCFGG